MSIRTGLVALGSTQGTALPLPAEYNVMATVAASTGVILPQSGQEEVYIRNGGANTLNVYPPVGYNIDAGTVNVAVTITAGTTARYVRIPNTGHWIRFDK